MENITSLLNIAFHKGNAYLANPAQIADRVERKDTVPWSVVLKSFFMDPPTHICDNVYLGNALHATTETTLKLYNIQAVVNVSKEIPCHYSKDIEYCWIQAEDVTQGTLKEHLARAYDFMRRVQIHDGNILVHCFMGASRSVAVLAYYLVRSRPGTTLDDALVFLKKQRPVVNINVAFYQELQKVCADLPL